MFAALVWSRLYGCCKIFNVTATASLTTDEFAAEPRHQQQCVCRGPAGAESQNTRRTRAKIFYLVAKNIHDRRRECGVTKHEDHVDVVCVVPVTPSFEMRRGFATRHSWFVLKIKYEVVLVGGNRAQADTSPPHRRNQEWNFFKNLESKILGVSI